MTKNNRLFYTLCEEHIPGENMKDKKTFFFSSNNCPIGLLSNLSLETHGPPFNRDIGYCLWYFNDEIS